MSGALNQSKSLRISALESYAGSEDIEAFNSWLQGLLRWLSLKMFL
jgi:hypothetical protein